MPALERSNEPPRLCKRGPGLHIDQGLGLFIRSPLVLHTAAGYLKKRSDRSRSRGRRRGTGGSWPTPRLGYSWYISSSQGTHCRRRVPCTTDCCMPLFVVRTLVARSGRSVQIEDRVPGRPEEGAAFRFTLRRAAWNHPGILALRAYFACRPFPPDSSARTASIGCMKGSLSGPAEKFIFWRAFPTTG